MKNSVADKHLCTRLLSVLRQDMHRTPNHIKLNSFETGVIAFALGIAVYFNLSFEPSAKGIGLAVVILAIGWWGLSRLIDKFPAQRSLAILRFIVLGCVLVGAGLGRAAWHTETLKTPFLPDYRMAYTLTGWVEAVEVSGSGYRWKLRVVDIEGRYQGPVPKRVRVKADVKNIPVGATVSVRALMAAPPGPVVPRGYDPARRAYFHGVGGYGFAISKPEILPDAAVSGTESLARHIARFRFGLADRIMAVAPERTAGLQAALLTGIRTYVPPEQTEALRIAGLAHMLAISGLHMGLLAGGGYAVMAFIFATIAPLSRRYDVRKFAALIGLLFATAYLILSGGTVSTQRAYIMAVIVFLALILDRRAFSMRSVALAALITLLLHPEGLMSAGFQMSFSAATALVVFYDYWRRIGFGRYTAGVIPAMRRSLIGITLTSVVAGGATAGFGMLHFNRVARYDLLGNVLAMPIFTFVVMPAALISLVLMPLGLESLPLAVMGWGIGVILDISHWVAGLDGALIHIASAPPLAFALFSAGFVGLCLGTNRLKGISIISFVVCLILWLSTPRPDMRVSEDGQIAFWSETRDLLYVGKTRSDRYGREQFIRRAGKAGTALTPYADSYALCDAQACRMEVRGAIISIASVPEVVPEECLQSDVVILTSRQAGPVARRNCAAELLDERIFRQNGAANIYITEGSVGIEPAKTAKRKSRPWSMGWNTPEVR